MAFWDTLAEPVALAAAAVVALLLVIGIVRRLGGRRKRLSYVRTQELFSATEREFLGSLQGMVTDRAVVLGKVALADLVEPQPDMREREWRTAFERLSEQRADFVLCDPRDYAVIGVIELDEAGQRGPKAQRDTFMEEVCQTAGLPFLRICLRDGHPPEMIKELVEDRLFGASMLGADRREPSLGSLPVMPERSGRREPVVSSLDV